MTSILVCTLGGSWAVIPEVYGFLAPDRLPLYRHHPQAEEFERQRAEYGLTAPDEIWVCTTQGRKAYDGIAALAEWCRLLPMPPVLRIWTAAGTNQLANQAECDHMRELILRACLLAQERGSGGQVVLSLAGGRKTMSADLQWAGSLFGCHALIHVVGCEPLPDQLTKELKVASMAEPLPGWLCAAVVPLVTGRSRRSDLLDVALDGRGPIRGAEFPLDPAPPGGVLAWPEPEGRWLKDELRIREREGSQLLGNYLSDLSRDERHENWRSLYRLPPRVIDNLRKTPVGPESADWLRRLPKADLHRHLGGCLDIAEQRAVGQAIWDALSTAERNAALGQVEPLLRRARWPANWPKRLKMDALRAHRAAALLVHATDDQLRFNLFGVTAPRIALKTRHRLGFAAYERPGELSGSAVLSHPAAIAPYAAAVVRGAQAEGLAYCELRGSPQKYGHGLPFLRAFKRALEYESASQPVERRTDFRFVLIADRRQRQRIGDVVRMAVVARAELGNFVAGIDLAGDEGTTRPDRIARSFLEAFAVCLPVTIHAGEGESAESIWQAAYHLHADRIGHGLTISDHPDLSARFRDRAICLELCPSSNREVVGFRDPGVPESADFPDYPLWSLWEQGLPLTLCTDNPGISRTTLPGEYLAAARMVGKRLTVWEALAMIKQAFVHAFLPSADKERLLKRADAEIYRLVLQHFGPM